MTKSIEITVPFGHEADPTCPHCFEPAGPHLRDLYPDSDHDALGGEHKCAHCDGPILVSVFRPEPVFAVVAVLGEPGVTHISRGRR